VADHVGAATRGTADRCGPGNARRPASRRTPFSLSPTRTRSTRFTATLPTVWSLDPDFVDWDPDDVSTWDERIVMVAEDADFDEWQREWLADNGAAANRPANRGGRLRRLFGRGD
jgi:hypothetical protein